MSRPAANNRITRQMAEAGVSALEEVRIDRRITGCVLTGEGDVFCTGGDYRGAGSSSADQLEFARAHNDSDIISIGRDLYYDTRCATPHDANARARLALVAALKALEESPASIRGHNQ